MGDFNNSALITCMDCVEEKRALPNLCYIHTFTGLPKNVLFQRFLNGHYLRQVKGGILLSLRRATLDCQTLLGQFYI